MSQSQSLTLSRNAISAAVLALAAAAPAHAVIAEYSEFNGAFSINWGWTNLSGGLFNGQTVAANTSLYRGADNGFLGFANPSGSMSWYAASTGVYLGNSLASVLIPGAGGVTGQIANNTAYQGADDASQSWYLDAGGRLHAYDNLNFGTNIYNPTYANFTGGTLSGQTVTAGLAASLKTVGPTIDMNNNYLMAVAGDGTLDHYYLPTTGAFTPFAHGNWTTFTLGPMAGLTLNSLNGAAAGTVGAITYRFLGTSGDSMYFDVSAVPEAATYAQLLVGLVGLGMVRLHRQRQAKG